MPPLGFVRLSHSGQCLPSVGCYGQCWSLFLARWGAHSRALSVVASSVEVSAFLGFPWPSTDRFVSQSGAAAEQDLTTVERDLCGKGPDRLHIQWSTPSRAFRKSLGIRGRRSQKRACRFERVGGILGLSESDAQHVLGNARRSSATGHICSQVAPLWVQEAYWPCQVGSCAAPTEMRISQAATTQKRRKTPHHFTCDDEGSPLAASRLAGGADGCILRSVLRSANSGLEIVHHRHTPCARWRECLAMAPLGHLRSPPETGTYIQAKGYVGSACRHLFVSRRKWRLLPCERADAAVEPKSCA